MTGINSQKFYYLGDDYENINSRANEYLGKYLDDPQIFEFNDQERIIQFTTEMLIPHGTQDRRRVMLLFSNPHPLSIKQGMFLSPNSFGRENLFWEVMSSSGWLPTKKVDRVPKKLVEICLNKAYESPYEFIFYCYYAFPTDYPEDIPKIFTMEYFEEVIQPEAADEFKRTIRETSVSVVITFNKSIFNLVSIDKIDRYIALLKKGNIIQSRIKVMRQDLPIYLTYPTGWRFHSDYMGLRKDNLKKIMQTIS